MEIENDVNLTNTTDINLEEEQKSFLETTIGKAVNTGLDIGIRALLPDLIEDQVIDIKDNLLKYGLKEGVNKTIESAIDLGKSTIGIVTGNFENIDQMQTAVKSGGIIDSLSTVLDTIVDKAKKAGVINSTVSSVLKKGKNTILNNIESNIEKSFTNQIKSIEKLNTYMENWKEKYNNQDFSGMEKQYAKIKNELSNLAPLESSLSQARTIENIHTLIKNNGQNFNLSETELSLLKNLS
jgi:hypothetical protein